MPIPIHSSCRRQTRLARGFTLIELIVVVAILVTIVAVVAPSFRSFLQGQQVKGLAYDLTTDLLLARSEALKRNVNVSITPNSGNWNSGWITQTEATEDQISARNESALAVSISDAPAGITFNVNGRVSAPVDDVRMTIRSGQVARCVELAVSGRARSSVGACT